VGSIRGMLHGRRWGQTRRGALVVVFLVCAVSFGLDFLRTRQAAVAPQAFSGGVEALSDHVEREQDEVTKRGGAAPAAGEP
jgi:hypothetical protein